MPRDRSNVFFLQKDTFAANVVDFMNDPNQDIKRWEKQLSRTRNKHSCHGILFASLSQPLIQISARTQNPSRYYQGGALNKLRVFVYKFMQHYIFISTVNFNLLQFYRVVCNLRLGMRLRPRLILRLYWHSTESSNPNRIRQ